MSTELLPKEDPVLFAIKILGVTPHASQALFLREKARTVVVCAGRRVGKSTAAAIKALYFAVVEAPGEDQFFLAPSFDQSEILWGYAHRMAAQSLLADTISNVTHSPFPSLSLSVRNAAGDLVESRILCRSLSDMGVRTRGHGAARITVDEAHFVSDVAIEQAVKPMLATSEHKQLALLSTPFGAAGSFFRHWQLGMSGEDPNVKSFTFPTSANPNISREWIEEQKKSMPDLAFRAEILAEFVDDQGAVFPANVISESIDDTITLGNAEGRVVLAIDPARYSDRSAVIGLDISEKPWRCFLVKDLAGRSYIDQAALVGDLSRRYGRAKVIMDATAHDQLLDTLKRDGVKVEGVVFTNTAKRELIDGLAIALEAGDLSLPNHLELLRELRYFRYETTASGNVKFGAASGEHDDWVCALALALKGARKPRIGTPTMAIAQPSKMVHAMPSSLGEMTDEAIDAFRHHRRR